MKVLLTGASGLVGSHVLDILCAQRIPTVVLLRHSSPTRFIANHLPEIEVRSGSICDPISLRQALDGISHLIHCAGCIKAVRSADFYQINQGGTRLLVEALNAKAGTAQRLVHISSLAASGPATNAQPARETGAPRPVSHYGKSKLAAEAEVRERCRCEYVILRPPVVYGPRDAAFLPLFKAVKSHLRPNVNPKQALSMVYVKDLAQAIVACLEHPAAAGRTYFVAGPEVVTARLLAAEIATQMKSWTVPCPLPLPFLWGLCLFHELGNRVTGKANILSLQKFAELQAPSWVCDGGLLRREIGYTCGTTLKAGLAETLGWYRDSGWL